MDRQELLRQIIIQDDEITMKQSMLATLLFLVNNNEETSTEETSSFEQLPMAYQSSSRPGKRGHSELRDETPSPIPGEPLNFKRPRIATATAPAPLGNKERISSDSRVNGPGAQPIISFGVPNLRFPRTDMSYHVYTPEQIMSCLPDHHPFKTLITTALVDLVKRFRGKQGERDLAIVATRMWRDATLATAWNSANEIAKDFMFERLLSHPTLGPFQLKDPKTQVSAPVPTPTSMTNDRLRAQLAVSMPRLDRGNTLLRADALRQVDANSRGKLEERVRLWLDNVVANQGQDVLFTHPFDAVNANVMG